VIVEGAVLHHEDHDVRDLRHRVLADGQVRERPRSRPEDRAARPTPEALARRCSISVGSWVKSDARCRQSKRCRRARRTTEKASARHPPLLYLPLHDCLELVVHEAHRVTVDDLLFS
jgi:hypothetical protein